MTVHMPTSYMLDKLLYLNADLMKCITYQSRSHKHKHQVITICFQI